MKKSYRNTIIRVAPEIYDELQKLQEETGRPISDIASMGLRYALDRAVMVEKTIYDIAFGERRTIRE